jgi:DNA-binding NarL/FixJ family response regulator
MTPLPQPRPYRLVIADDHAVVRAGIATLLEGAGGLKVVAQASTARVVLSKLDATSRTEAVAIARRRGLIETD